MDPWTRGLVFVGLWALVNEMDAGLLRVGCCYRVPVLS
eukprot:COSAG02_NODE_530_length_20697_cov_20.103457_22_plen_38_part_00